MESVRDKSKILFISGSPRNGNTDFVLSKICESIKYDCKEIVLLRDKKILTCRGCLYCHKKPNCLIKDDMEDIAKKVLAADIIILGTPNYFDNVSGLMKNFIDRCHPFYKHKLLVGKKVVLIYVGGGGPQGTKKYLDLAFGGFIKYLNFNLLGSYSFQALEIFDLKNKMIYDEIGEIVELINSNMNKK